MNTTILNNLFNFGRSLPEPFDTLSGKKVAVASKYSAGAKTESTLCATVIKAVQSVCRCITGNGEGAVGEIDHRTVAEYKSSAGADEFHIVVYDSSSGNIMASVYDRSTEMQSTYVLNASARDGAAVMMALFPILMKDEEFRDHFEGFLEEFKKGFADLPKATEHMAYLCDNTYRRVKDETCDAHIRIELDKAGNLMRIPRAQMDSGNYMPHTVLAGEFTILAKTGPATIQKATVTVEHSDFVGKYRFGPRVLTALEERLVPKLPPWYIIPQEVVDICNHAKATTGKPTQMRNFLLRGPAGTGKTMGAKAIAAGLGLPYVKYTCSAGTEIFDFIGQVLPRFDGGSTGNAELDREREALMAMGGINYANVAALLHLPGVDDIDYDPAGVYRKLTEREKPDATAQECMTIMMDLVAEKIKALSKQAETPQSNAPSYTYEETDFIKALKNGYVVEIQEPTTIVQPGVMVGLNSLLEQEGCITLPTGEVIRRHPDAVVVVTTNISYEGCRGMNQSTIDRMSLVRDIELPSPEVMVQRAMSVTGATDEILVGKMVDVVNTMEDYCRKNSITDGAVGMRSLIDWIASTEITKDPYLSALYTVVSKATSDEADREAIVTAVLEPTFPPSRLRV